MRIHRVVAVAGAAAVMAAVLVTAVGNERAAATPASSEPIEWSRFSGGCIFGVDGVVRECGLDLAYPDDSGATQPYEQIVTTGTTSCGIARTDRLVRCWGQSSFLTGGNPLEHVMAGIGSADHLELSHSTTGGTRICAVATDGRVWCWGTSVPRHPSWPGTTDFAVLASPTLVPSIVDADAVTFASELVCVGRGGALVTCFGPGLEALGFSASARLADLPLSPAADQLVGGGSYLCVRSDTAVRCRGQLPGVDTLGGWEELEGAKAGPIAKLWRLPRNSIGAAMCTLSTKGFVTCWHPNDPISGLGTRAYNGDSMRPFPQGGWIDGHDTLLRHEDGPIGRLGLTRPRASAIEVSTGGESWAHADVPGLRIGVAGDSFTSGEGLSTGVGRYRCGTDVHEGDDESTTSANDPCPALASWFTNRCHRSDVNAGQVARRALGVPDDQYFDISCSGATIAQQLLVDRGTPEVDDQQERPRETQLEYLGRKSGGDLDVVILGAGGNDMYEGGLLQYLIECAERGCADPDLDAEVAAATLEAGWAMQTAIRESRSAAPGAAVVVLGYPRTDQPGTNCMAQGPLGAANSHHISEEVIPRLNDALARAAAAEGATFAGMYDAEDLLGDVLAGHRLCDADPWVNGFRLGDEWPPAATESFHLDEDAHRAIGLALAAQLDDLVEDQPSTATPPSKVSNLAGAVGSTSATLSWTAPADNGSALLGYLITPYRSGVAQDPLFIRSTSTTLTVDELTTGATYAFRVAAINGMGMGPTTTVNPGPIGAPRKVESLTATVGDASARLTWSAATANGSTVTGYTLTPSVGGVSLAPIQLPASPRSYTVNGLTNGATYKFKLTATNARGTGAAASVTTKPIGAPAKVSGLKVAPGDASATLTWSPPTAPGLPVTGYTIVPSQGDDLDPIHLPASATSHTVTGLANGAPATFTVHATNGTTRGPGVSVTSGPIGAPGKVSGAKVTPGIGSATLRWATPASPGAPITSYVITLRIDGAAQPVEVHVGSTTSRVVTGLPSGAAISFTVAATNAHGTGPTSSAAKAAVVG